MCRIIILITWIKTLSLAISIKIPKPQSINRAITCSQTCNFTFKTLKQITLTIQIRFIRFPSSLWIWSLCTTYEPLIWESNSLLRIIWVISNLAPLPGSFDRFINTNFVFKVLHLLSLSTTFCVTTTFWQKKFSCHFRCMPSSTRSNKETQLLFWSDPTSLKRSIRKEIRSSSIDNNTCSSLDFC